MGKGHTPRPFSVSYDEYALRHGYAFRPEEERHLEWGEWVKLKREKHGKIYKGKSQV